MRTVLCLVFSTLFVTATFAQPAATPKLVAGEPNADAAQRKPLGLSSADIHVTVSGGIAETTMVLTFRNETPRVLEGELTIPLPEGATVSGFGLDVNGTIVDGVPVERQKARVTYESESRKRIDPGLVEQTVGNNFQTRVYPIPANGSRTVKLQYVSDVIESTTGPMLRVPLKWDETIDEASVEIDSLRAAEHGDVSMIRVVPKVEKGPKDLAFGPVGNRDVARQTYKAARFTEDLVVTFPKSTARTESFVEKHLKAATMQQLLNGEAARVARNEFYFVVHDTPPVLIERTLSNPPLRIGILWDASLSRLEADKTRELGLLKKLVATLAPEAEIDLVVFRNIPEAPVTFAAKEGAAALFEHLSKVIYDGGTNLSLLTAVKNYTALAGAGAIKHLPENYAYWLLFTDGIADLGPEMPIKLEAPVYTIANDAKANHTLLRRIAAQSAGQYFNLQRMDDDAVAGALTAEPYLFLGLDADPNQVTALYPAGAQPLTGPRLTLTGKLLAPEAKVMLKYGRAGVVTNKVEITLKQSDATATSLISRFWAQQKVADLSSDVDANAEALADVGRDFNLVTPNTSLIVLETVEQYLQHKIVPPATFAKVHDDFMSRIEQQKAQVAQTNEQRIQQVLTQWNERVKWWETDFKYPAGFAFKQPADGNGGSGGGSLLPASSAGTGSLSLATDAAAATSPAAPAPAALPAQARSVGRAREAGERAAALQPQAESSTPRNDFLLASQADGFVKAKAGGEPDGPSFSIAVKSWDPNVPYLKSMRESQGDGPAAYQIYLKQRPAYVASPAFYLDCAEYLFRNGQKALATRVLTNVAELKLENAQLLRIVAHKLNQSGDRDLAINLFEKILKLRPEEPQSHRDLALAIADRADAYLATSSRTAPADVAMRDYERALDLLNHVIMTPWDRFEGIEVTALMEANRIIASMFTVPAWGGQLKIPLDPRLQKRLDLDVRIVLTWDADLTDVDLWVTEPSGETCIYSHNRTTIGGLLSRDFTQGYGPEEYCLKRTMPGQYKIQANYYGSSQTSLVGPCTVQATVITNFGRATEKRETMTLRLDTAKQVVDIGTVTLGVEKVNK